MAASTFLNPVIQNIEQLKDRVLKLLGYPLITIELTDEQLDLCFQRACELYTKYATFDTEYLIVNLRDKYVAGEGIDLSEWDVAVVNTIDGQGLSNAGLITDTIWSLPNAMMASGAYPFFGSGGMGAGNWVTYHAACEWMELSRRMVGGMTFQYNRFTKKLVLTPEPTDLDRSILISVERMPTEEMLCGNEYVQRIMLAYCKILLGTIRKKFSNMPLLGGAQVDISIGDQGQEELNEILQNIRKDESEGHGFIIA